MNILDGLNKEQKEAVEHIEGPCLVLAGAGSGKTKVLTMRIANLIQHGIYSGNILAITFTNKAAKEMRERISNVVDDNYAFVGTFHSFGLKIIRENYEALGLSKNFTIIDSDDVTSIIKKILKDLDYDPKQYSPGFIRNKISFIKNEMLSDAEVDKFLNSPPEQVAAKVYFEYERVLRRNNAVDFDDLLKMPVELFLHNEEVLDHYQEKYQYILIDEYQDTNEVQYKMVKKLAEKYRNLFVVGDINQCIHEDSLLNTKNGIKKIKNITTDDEILSGVGNGLADYQKITHISKRRYNDKIITIITSTGKKLSLTPEHVCFYKLPLEEGKYYVYLMYRKNMGYRIGQTISIRSTGTNQLQNGLKIHLLQEHGDKIWVLKVCDNASDASYYEELFSSAYGIPKTCFHANGRRISLNQEQLNSIFSKIDTSTRAAILMNDHGLSADYPFYKAQGTTRKNKKRQLININYLAGSKQKIRNYNYQRIAFNTTDDELKLTLSNAGFNVRKGKNNDFRIETERTTGEEAEKFAEKILMFTPDTEINYQISLDKGKKYHFINAGSLREGMIIPVLENGIIIEDRIIKIICEYKNCEVYDLTIPTTRNIIADNICVHNCIYGFRWSNYRNILNFEKDYPEAKSITLNQNYRSTNTILNAANSVIKNNTESKEVNLFSELGDGVKVKYMRSYDEKHEVTLIMEEIKKLLNSGYHYQDIAILYRTNAQSRTLEEGMLKANYPYKVVGSYYFYKRKEIKDLLSYLRLISNHADDVSLTRVINVPKRGIGSKSIEDLETLAREQNTSMFEVLSKPKELEFKNLILELTEASKDIDLTELIDLVLEKSGMKAEMEKDKTLESELRLENLMEFKSITENYQHETGTVNLEDFLEDISLVADVSEHNDNDEAITLMTMHSAKGLEFKVVFLAGMEENIMPHSMSLQDKDGIEEERRLCYVAITRAKERLYITNAKRRMLFGNTNMNPPSRFIGEIEPSLIDKEDLGIKEAGSFDKEKYYNKEATDYQHGEVVYHMSFGRGVVVDCDDRFVTVAFDKRFGIKKFLSNYQGLKRSGK